MHTFLTTQGHIWPPQMRDELNAGPPPRQHEHKRRYTPFTYSFMLTRWIWKDDYDGQMIFRNLRGLKLPDICLTSEEKPWKTSLRKPVSTGYRPEPSVWQACMLPPAPQQWTSSVFPCHKYHSTISPHSSHSFRLLLWLYFGHGWMASLLLRPWMKGLNHISSPFWPCVGHNWGYLVLIV